MPFSCAACGRTTFPELLPAAGDVLRCPACGEERPFIRPPFLVVTGTCGIGKSTVCAALTGTIPGAVLLDGDLFAEDMVSVAGANEDYSAFWRSMMRLAHELAQSDLTVVFFSTMLPDQVLANTDVLAYFDGAHFLCLSCPGEVLRGRLASREGPAADGRAQVWIDFDRALVAAAATTPSATVLDAARAPAVVAADVAAWIKGHVAMATSVPPARPRASAAKPSGAASPNASTSPSARATQ